MAVCGCGGDPSGEAAPTDWVRLVDERPIGRERPEPRVGSGPFALDAYRLEVGTKLAFRLTDLQDAVLRFSSAVEPLPEDDSSLGALVTLRVLLDDVELLATEQTVAAVIEPRAHELPLPDTAEGVLRFTAEGPDAVARVIAPVIGPREIGVPGDRPWDGQPPNLLLFVADTLRADALGCYGDDREVTPHLDAFAEQALRFESAWSPSTWTLPAVSSLLLGVYPGQHGAVEEGLKPTEAVATLAGTLAAAGYRTGAVTDSLFVSRKFGLDRGFEWFMENGRVSVDDTFASVRAFLDADDGRPFFLLVHSYKAHEPYDPEPATRALHGERLGLEGTHEVLIAELQALFEEHVAAGATAEELAAVDPARVPLLGRLRNLYLGGVLDLDRLFGRVVDELDTRGLRDASVVAFTSDHGEAFMEHDCLGHGNGAWNEVLHVPLMLRVPGREAGVVPRNTSTVYLAATLCDLAGVPIPPHWQAHSLLEGRREHPAFSFQIERTGQEPQLSVQGLGYKLVLPAAAKALERGHVLAAYDLAADPDERHDLAPERAEELSALVQRLGPRLQQLQQRIGPVDAIQVDGEHLERLKALGYVSDDG